MQLNLSFFFDLIVGVVFVWGAGQCWMCCCSFWFSDCFLLFFRISVLKYYFVFQGTGRGKKCFLCWLLFRSLFASQGFFCFEKSWAVFLCLFSVVAVK